MTNIILPKHIKLRNGKISLIPVHFLDEGKHIHSISRSGPLSSSTRTRRATRASTNST
jgi:hypothetical protein